ncbi:MAG: Flp family type IVb pilin [Hyphomicrobiales bacterium]|nr:MAG: Flp family type IVb pilin [Hyphomicrobiales bacterium]
MRQIATMLAKFSRDERGATAIEYGFIAAFMTVAVVALIAQIGVNVGELTSRIIPGLK